MKQKEKVFYLHIFSEFFVSQTAGFGSMMMVRGECWQQHLTWMKSLLKQMFVRDDENVPVNSNLSNAGFK